jgi:DNA repair exonuclease SbcCD ATPase subunit
MIRFQDEEKLKDINARLDAEVLEQEDELADLERQIEEEEAALAEIENDDKVYLEELKETIKEQTWVYEDFPERTVPLINPQYHDGGPSAGAREHTR